ncbi:hypothetical protein QR680_004130 [Steinernema hermaphroditum]|uniref:EGF-like domain-containing protein n=1 Tax=Steinernema hermaphroditum TaxID=289476 RepID=A0AA39HMR4_9BILA|nr:hypothetical protein QR680_004130 [Steinernema hermaphroditum]
MRTAVRTTAFLLLFGFHFSVAQNGDNASKSSEESRDSPPSAIKESSATSMPFIQDALGPLYFPQSYKVTCCMGGTPIHESEELVRNWTQHASDYLVENGSNEGESNCRAFQGEYLISATAIFRNLKGSGVRCQCPDVGGQHRLDRYCRKMPPCLNKGYRMFSGSMKCICPEPYFGDRCQKYCDQGQRIKGADGRDYCSCVPFYQGEECRDMVCLNNGTIKNERCHCPPNFLGYHCEIDTRGTSGSRFQRYGEQGSELFSRDVSGTIFSLIMIVVLVVSMYLLMKHRMQVQSRFTATRREFLTGAGYSYPGVATGSCAISGGRRDMIMTPEDARIMHFRPLPMVEGGPPPYVPPGSRGRTRRNETLPPLPSYEDATKLPPLRQNVSQEEAPQEEQQSTEPESVSALAQTVTSPSEDQPSSSTSPSMPVSPSLPSDTPSPSKAGDEQDDERLKRSTSRRSI